MKKKIVLTAASLALLAGCASFGNSSQRSQHVQIDEGPLSLGSENGAAGLRPLQEASLPSGECGMILWTLEGARPSAIFRFISGKQAEMNVLGRPVSFERVDYDGAGDFGVYEQQLFRSDDGLEVEIASRFGLGFNGGAYLERGLIKLRDNDGWSIVAPAAGIAGCRS
jgi:hypothetical protein